MSKLFFPCKNCERDFPVEISQAGREVECPFCGQSASLPRLSQLRNVSEKTETSKRQNVSKSSRGDSSPSKRLSIGQTWLFVGGIPLALAGLILGSLYAWHVSVARTNMDAIDLEAMFEQRESRIDGLSDEQFAKFWNEEIAAREGWPEKWRQSNYQLFKQQIAAGQLLSVVAFIIGFIGVAMILASFYVGRKKA